MRAYLKNGFGIEVLGGGRILHDVERLGVQEKSMTMSFTSLRENLVARCTPWSGCLGFA